MSSEPASTLHCPNCGGEHLHQDAVDVFMRDEDAETGLHVAAQHGEPDRVRIDANMAGNPSERRHGLSVSLSCESCDAILKLHIAQHKGTTQLALVDERE